MSPNKDILIILLNKTTVSLCRVPVSFSVYSRSASQIKRVKRALDSAHTRTVPPSYCENKNSYSSRHGQMWHDSWRNERLSCRRGTARRSTSSVILSTATQPGRID